MATSRTGYLAIRHETTPGTPRLPNKFIAFKSGGIKYNQEIIKNNPIKGVRFNALHSVKGKINTDGEHEIDVDAKDIGYFFHLAFGKVVTTNLTGAYKHTFTVANDLPSITLEQLDGNPEGVDYQVSRGVGVKVDTFEMSASDGIVTAKVTEKATGLFLKANLTSNASAGSGVACAVSDNLGLVNGDSVKITDVTNDNSEDITATTIAEKTITATIANSYDASDDVKFELKPQTPSFDCDNTIFRFYNAKWQFGSDLSSASSASDENVENWTFTYNNQLEERFGSKGPTPSVIAPKGASAMVKFTKFFESNLDRDRYLDQTRQACILTLDLEKKIGTTAFNYKIEFKFNDLRFTTHDIPTGTDDLLITEIEAEVFYNCTDGKELEVNLWNDLADYKA